MGQASTFNVEICRRGSIAVVRPTGDLDLATAPHLEAALAEAKQGSSELIVDLRDLTFLDCAGLRTLLVADRDSQTSVGFIRGARSIHRIFELTGTDEHVAWVPAPEGTAEPRPGAGGSGAAPRTERTL